MFAFVTFNSSLVPLIEVLCNLNSCEFESRFSGFRRNWNDEIGINSPSLWPTEPRLHVRSITIPSSSSSNGPATTPLTTRGLCPAGSVIWAGPKLVRPHRLRSWVIIICFKILGPNCRGILHCPLPKATLVCLKRNEENPEKELEPAPGRSRTHNRFCTFPIRKWYWTGQWACWPRWWWLLLLL